MQKVLQVKRGEVYLAHLYGIGSEQRGKRPVVILQNDVGNLHSPTTLIAPLTSSPKKRNLPVHIKVRNNHLYQNSTVLLEQVQVLDKSRLHKKLCNPDVPLITIKNHHDGIISREIWDLAQKQIFERGQLSREGRKYSKHYWFSSKVFCGKCGYSYNVSGQTSREKRPLRCVNRAKYGSTPRVDANGAEVGCDSKSINETVLAFCMKYILEHIQLTRTSITERLMNNIVLMQQNEPAVNTQPLKDEIENLTKKKRKAIDLMLDGLISKEDLKQQTEYYDSEIARLTEQIAASQNVSEAHKKQLEAIRNYIAQVNRTAEIDTNSTKIYGELLKKVVVHKEGVTDFYLTCVPFGFRMNYHIHRYNRGHLLEVLVDKCEVIS